MKDWNFSSSSLMTWSKTTDRIGILNDNPGYSLDVSGIINTSIGYYIEGIKILSPNAIEFAPRNDTFIDFKIPSGNADYDGRI
jgi:hypothetical protein